VDTNRSQHRQAGRRRARTWLLRGIAALVVSYLAGCAALAWIMVKPPQESARIIRHIPMPLAWGVLPGPSIWGWARKGTLARGDEAPDFTLPMQDGGGSVTLSSFRGRRPVVLVFGSYT
jgi:hypothetical protein